MPSTALKIPPELATPQEREKFFRHTLQDHGVPVKSRAGALEALTRLIEKEAYAAGRRAGALEAERHGPKAPPAPVMYRAMRVAWETLERDGQIPAAGSRGPARLLDDEQLMASFVAIAVRNALESFDTDHIPNGLMKEFNTVLRSAIYTALHAAEAMLRSERAAGWVASQLIHIPPYWEPPKLLDAYVRGTKGHGEAATHSSQ